MIKWSPKQHVLTCVNITLKPPWRNYIVSQNQMQEDQTIHRLKIRMGGSTMMSSTPGSRTFVPFVIWIQFTSLSLFTSFPSVTEWKQDYLRVHTALWLRIGWGCGRDRGWTQQNAACPDWPDLFHQTSVSPFWLVTWQALPRSSFAWKFCELWSFLGLFESGYPWGCWRSGMWSERLGRKEIQH